MKTIYPALFILAACLLGGCRSASILTLGENSLIRYQQFDRDSGEVTLEMVLVEETHKDYQDLYSVTRTDANIKKVPSLQFSKLLETFEDLGFVEMAHPRELGVRPRTDDATKAISVENDRNRWVAMNSKNGLTAEQRPNFYLMERMFLNCYDSVLSLQVITNEEGSKLFYEEQRRLEQENKKRINQ